MKRLNIVLLILCAVLLLHSSLALCKQISITVAPPIVDISVPSGGVRTFKLIVSNLGDKEVDVRGYISDLILAYDGSPRVLNAGENEYSCAKWVTLTAENFKLKPGSKKVVGATLKVPRGVKGGRYAVILFESSSMRKRNIGNIVLGARLGTIVMLSIPWTLKRDVEVSNIEFNTINISKKQGTKKRKVEFKIFTKNKGNVHIKVKGSAVIKNKSGEIIDRVPIQVGTGTILPNGERIFLAVWENVRKMKKGFYTVEARMNYKGGRQARKELKFSLQ